MSKYPRLELQVPERNSFIGNIQPPLEKGEVGEFGVDPFGLGNRI